MKKALLLIAGSLFSLMLSAQTRVISGTITAKEDGQPLTGVNVVVKGTSKGASSDVDGKYSIEMGSEDKTLMFSYIGYVTQSIEAGANEVIDVTMEQDVKTLSDIVVVGYGTQRKSDLTG